MSEQGPPALSDMVVRYERFAEFVAGVSTAIAQTAGTAIVARGRAVLALSGGQTPRPIYAALGNMELPWEQVTLTLTDERLTPPSSPDSNQRMVTESLMNSQMGGPAARANFVPLWSEGASLIEIADTADRRLQAVARPYDLVVLGMGEDGHVASLFPGSSALAEGMNPATARLCLPVRAHDPQPKVPRLTQTLPALLNARAILLAIAGPAKYGTLERAGQGDDVQEMPVRAIFQQTRTPVTIHWSAENG